VVRAGAGQNYPWRVVVLAHPRSGSNSLVEILERHDGVTIVNEPFNENFASWGTHNVDYLARLHAGESFPALIDELFNQYTGLKELTYQLDDAALRHLVDRPEIKVVALRRRNLLQTAVSQVAAERSGLWKTWDASKPLENYYDGIGALSLADVRGRMDWAADESNRLERFLIDVDPSRTFRLDYEDLYEVSQSEALKLVDEMGRFLGLQPSRHLEIAHYLSDEVRQARPSTYGRITNLQQIEAAFGGDSTGHLPAWTQNT
jgi:LPS sulfotransferase NodH